MPSCDRVRGAAWLEEDEEVDEEATSLCFSFVALGLLTRLMAAPPLAKRDWTGDLSSRVECGILHRHSYRDWSDG